MKSEVDEENNEFTFSHYKEGYKRNANERASNKQKRPWVRFYMHKTMAKTVIAVDVIKNSLGLRITHPSQPLTHPVYSEMHGLKACTFSFNLPPTSFPCSFVFFCHSYLNFFQISFCLFCGLLLFFRILWSRR